MKKKLLTFLLAICILPCAFAAVACDNSNNSPDTTSKLVVMQINNPSTSLSNASMLSTSLCETTGTTISPAIEFVIDANNKVDSVSALNDEGYDVLAGITINLSILTHNVADAANTILTIAKNKGYVTNAVISISVSSDAAQTIYNEIKTKISETVDVSKIQSLVSLNKSNLVDKVKECYPELSTEAIEALSDQQLIAKLKDSHTATSDLNNEALKEMYLAVKQRVYGLARLAISNPLGFQTNLDALETAFTTFANTWLVDGNNNKYLNALNAYVNSKTVENLSALELALNEMKTALGNALAEIDNIIGNEDKTITLSAETINQIDTAMNNYLKMLTGNIVS